MTERETRCAYRQPSVVATLIGALLLVTLPQAAIAQGRSVIQVSTVAQLESAVNDPANEGAVVKVLPNIDSAGNPTPYLVGTPLILQPHMDLVGQLVEVNGTTKKPILDGSLLPSQTLILFGRNNNVRNLVLQNRCDDALLASSRPSDVVSGNPWHGAWTGGFQAEVTGCTFERAFVGLGLFNGAGTEGFRSHFIVDGNQFEDTALGIGNANLATTDARIHTIVRNNTLTRNGTGLVGIGGQSGSYNEVDLLTERNTFIGNTTACSYNGGRNYITSPPSFCGNGLGAHFNQVRVTQIGDTFENNNLAVRADGADQLDLVLRPFLLPGFFGSCDNPQPAEESSNNSIDLQVLKASLAAGTGQRLFVFLGALGLSPIGQARSPGDENEVRALIRNSTSTVAAGALSSLFLHTLNQEGPLAVLPPLPASCPQAPRVIFALASPPDPPSNQVVFVGSDVAFEAANDLDVDVPDAFFQAPPP